MSDFLQYVAATIKVRGDGRIVIDNGQEFRERLAAALNAQDERALWGVVANAGRLSAERKVRWAHVSDATGLGSNKSAELCRRFERDPDELVGGSASLGVGRE